MPVPASDVTAVLLSLDEPYAARALAAVARQVPALADVVHVRDVAPFHRALNAGAARVRTPYFVQVDADMVPDPTCAADLRAAMGDGVGVVIGHLRDALLGRVAGIKLFRTACFAAERFPDSVSPDTDFYNAMARRGWSEVYGIAPPTGRDAPSHVFGEHAPDYTPAYTFRKFRVLGARHRYRRAAASLLRLAQQLHASPHPAAPLALTALAAGVVLPPSGDLLRPLGADAAFDRLARLFAAPGGGAAVHDALTPVGAATARDAWQRGWAYGVQVRGERAAASLAAALRRLGDELSGAHGPLAWSAMVGICSAVVAGPDDDQRVDEAFASLNQVLPYPFRESPAGR